MSRPVRPRTTKSYARDIENLGRLRLAIKLDPKLPSQASAKVIAKLDALVDVLVPIWKNAGVETRA